MLSLQFSQALPTTLVVALLLASLANADFHNFNCGEAVGACSQLYNNGEAIAVPSNQYDCNGAENAPVFDGTNGVSDESPQYESFSITNFCGTNIDFYPASDGQTIPFYISGGDGTVQGTCYPGSGDKMSCVVL
ncbi:hypothetical protein SCP_1200990 [Sparassis crispa]|uniref:Uncharacterized protein n=1 Tax=Sparassis crispa TaxID=139825 RepID=A0A401H0D5_9APHY|nr:hypothetical protein SCP_1200990 [Sparassis crispa]GBE87874.1 hypothetical protein SCP_1200990 [Sparassis crispa]